MKVKKSQMEKNSRAQALLYYYRLVGLSTAVFKCL